MRFSLFLWPEKKRDFTQKAVDHKEDAEIAQQKKKSYEAFEGHNQKDILVRDILQTVQQKHNEEMQNSPRPANEKKNAITYLKLKRGPGIINLVLLMKILWQTIAQPALGKEAPSVV